MSCEGVVVGVSDFLMMNLARGTVAVGKKVGNIVAESDVSLFQMSIHLFVYPRW